MSQNLNDSGGSLTRREREKLAHRQDIMDAAIRVFTQKGFPNATLDEIAQEAEFSKSAIYLYFSNKEDLFYSIIKDKITSSVQFMRDLLDGKGSFKQELLNLFNGFAELSFKETDFFKLLMTQHIASFKLLSEEKCKNLISIHDEINEIVINRVTKAREDGELKDICTEAVNGIIHGALENMVITHWNSDTLEELQMRVVLFIDIIFNGIAKTKENEE